MGSRICKGSVTVNQNISLSFDPATLTCLTCDDEHMVIADNANCYILADQNFVANLSGAKGSGSCVGVVRLEDASLDELVELFFEIFDRCSLRAPSFALAPDPICTALAQHFTRRTGTAATQNSVLTTRELGSVR